MSRTPSLAELISEAIRFKIEEVRVAIPARVEKYRPDEQTIDASVLIKNVLVDSEGNMLEEELPVIPNVPVCFPRGGGYFLSFPLKKGDFVFLVCADACIDSWRDKGTLSDPGFLRHHDLSDAVAFPGVYPDPKALKEASDTELSIGADGGLQMRVGGSLIELGTTGGSLDFVALAQKVLTELQSIVNGFNSHIHTTTATVGTGPVGVISTPTSPLGSPNSVAADKVKAE